MAQASARACALRVASLIYARANPVVFEKKQMTKSSTQILLLAAALLASGIARADAPPNYATLMGTYVIEDKARAGDHGIGGILLYGSPLNDVLSLELGAFTTRLDRKDLSVKDYQYAFGADLMGKSGNGRLAGFVLGGLGSIYEDFPGTEALSPYVDVGAGALLGLTQNIKLRGEARWYEIFNGRTYADKKALGDVHLNLGLQVSFGELLAEKKVVAPPAPAAPIDSDGDGVPDSRDLCPGTPIGTLVDENGCPKQMPVTDADSDGDGVPDSIDQCPGTPPGVVVDGTGCPIDEDGDGVPNAQDKCPHTPRGLKVDENGCAIEAQTIVILKGVQFEFDKADLTADARQVLDGVAAGMQSQPTMQVEIGGHTDSLGTAAYNLTLSQRRADSVRDYLISRGVDGARMKAEGYGKYQPIAENETEDGRAKNRRVEFKIVKQ
jgi:OOP family OmpA-OmpF porin